MKVLVVDDSSTMRRILQNCLAEAGYKDVVQASDGIEALDVLAKDKSVDLMLVDWHMPNMDGFTLLQEVKGRPDYKNIKIIMVTTQAEKQSVVEALQAGASSYVVKPFTPEVIKDKISEVIK